MKVEKALTATRIGFMLLALTGMGRGQAADPPIVGTPLPPTHTDPAIAAAIAKISPEAIHADIARLVSFGTRNTLSSMSTGLSPGAGINAAADWVESEFKAISAQCGGCLEVKRDTFMEPGTAHSRIVKPTKLTNIYAILHGTAKGAPWVLVTGHYDSRATDVVDADIAAPGANDDASGTAVSLESARAIIAAKLRLPGTIVFVAVAGEEQGLNGSRHLAHLAREENWPLEAVLNNDIVGGDTTPGDAGAGQDKNAVRLFSESIPSNASPELQKQYIQLGAENDSPSRQLARTVAEIAPAYFPPSYERPASRPGQMHSQLIRQIPGFHPVLIERRDRYLRSGDHTSFNGEGFAAVRFTEWRENFDHQHQTLRTENGTEYGDLLKFVDTAYVANVARMNAAVLLTLASAPGQPQNVRVLTQSLDNDTELSWEPPASGPPPVFYEVVWRDPTEMLWTHVVAVAQSPNIRLNVSKDNVLFGVRSVDANGHYSLAVSPVPAGRTAPALTTK